MKLSILIPAYNEEKTIKDVIDSVKKVNLGKIKKEIVVVDDGSKDNTAKILKKIRGINLVIQKKNSGKGFAIRTAINHATGDFIAIQDADLEYNPEDYKDMIKPLIEKRAEIVYGCRFSKKPKHRYKLFLFGNKFLSLLASILYGSKVEDIETCYKMMPRKIIESLNLKSNHFEIEPEITAKILKKKYKILEVPISYKSRSFKEGKKITWKDGLIAIWILVKYRLIDYN